MQYKHKLVFQVQNNEDMSMVIDNTNSKINYFIPGPQQEADKRAITDIMKQEHGEFKDVFTGIGSFIGTFLLQMTSP